MEPWMIVAIVVAVVLIGAVVALYFWGKKMEKKQAEQQEMMNANSQVINLMVIDKKKMKLRSHNHILLDRSNVMR